VACIGERRDAYRILVGKSEKSRSFRKPSLILGYNVRMVLKGIYWQDNDRIFLAQDRGKLWAFLNKKINLQILRNAGKDLAIVTTSSFCRRNQLHAVSWLEIKTQSACCITELRVPGQKSLNVEKSGLLRAC
jgi:hypothetical protein